MGVLVGPGVNGDDEGVIGSSRLLELGKQETGEEAHNREETTQKLLESMEGALGVDLEAYQWMEAVQESIGVWGPLQEAPS